MGYEQGRHRCNALRRSFHRVISDHLGSRSKSDISIFRKAFGSRRQANSVHSGLNLSFTGIFRLLHTPLWQSFVGRAHKSFQIDRTSRTSSRTSRTLSRTSSIGSISSRTSSRTSRTLSRNSSIGSTSSWTTDSSLRSH